MYYLQYLLWSTVICAPQKDWVDQYLEGLQGMPDIPDDDGCGPICILNTNIKAGRELTAHDQSQVQHGRFNYQSRSNIDNQDSPQQDFHGDEMIPDLFKDMFPDNIHTPPPSIPLDFDEEVIPDPLEDMLPDVEDNELPPLPDIPQVNDRPSVFDILVNTSKNEEPGDEEPGDAESESDDSELTNLNATEIKLDIKKLIELMPVGSTCKTRSGKDPGKNCIIPFTYNFTIFNGCTLKFASDGLPWCATQVDSARVAIADKTGTCELTCPMASVDTGYVDYSQSPVESVGPVGLLGPAETAGNVGPIESPVGNIGQGILMGPAGLAGPVVSPVGSANGVKTVADVVIGESENGESEGESENGESESGGSALNATAIKDLLPASSACLTKSGKDPGKPCVAPFIYNLTVFTGCTLRFATDGKPWCATQVDGNGVPLVGKTGKCDLTCPMSSVDMGGWTGPEDGGSESTSEGPESADDEAGAESISEGPESENDEAGFESTSEGPESEDDEAGSEGSGEGKSGSEYYASDAAADGGSGSEDDETGSEESGKGEPENDSRFYTNKIKNQNHKGYYKKKQQSNAFSGYYMKKKKEAHNFYSNYYAKKKKEEENKNDSGYYAKKKKEEYYGPYYAKKKEEKSKHYSGYYAKKRKEKYHFDYNGKAKTYVLSLNL